MDINQDKSSVPTHIGIIMDGNGRWAQKRNKPRTAGHEEGLKRSKAIAKKASDLGIKYLTLYAFSTENWKRAKQEVGFLMNLIHNHLYQELDFYKENKIKVKLLGNAEGLTKEIQNDIYKTEKDTEHFTGLTVCLAINYGGKDEIIRGMKKMLKTPPPQDYSKITEETLTKNLDIENLPDADMIIRTGGEKRLSNFLMWQSAYSELFFSDTLWPDYSEEEFENTIGEFKNRTRRFGAVLT